MVIVPLFLMPLQITCLISRKFIMLFENIFDYTVSRCSVLSVFINFGFNLIK